MITGIINKIIPFSSVDGPGNRTAIFLQGCNFNCIYCHNPETINKCSDCKQCIKSCKAKALVEQNHKITWKQDKCVECDACIKCCKKDSSAKVMVLTPEELIAKIKPHKIFIQGITVSGGECTLQQEFLIELFKQAKSIGLSCFIDTNGSNDFEQMPELLDLCDGVMLDVKVWDKAKHKEYIGYENKTVIKNLKYLLEKNKLYEVRTVVVPGIFDNKETVEEVAKIIGASEQEIKYKLIKFRDMGVRTNKHNLRTPSQDEMEQLQVLAKSYNVEDSIII